MSNAAMKREEIADTAADARGRLVVTESAGVGGERTIEERGRALTLAEKLYHTGAIGFDEWTAAGTLRNMHFLLLPPSEGVSSYGQSAGGADPARKGDRKAKRITGIEVLLNGEVVRGNSRDNRSDVWRYRDALFAMCGLHDDEGSKVVDRQVALFMIRACTDSERMPTQTEIGRARAPHIKDDGARPSKQVTAIGASFVKEHLRRLAMHLRMIKGEAIR